MIPIKTYTHSSGRPCASLASAPDQERSTDHSSPSGPVQKRPVPGKRPVGLWNIMMCLVFALTMWSTGAAADKPLKVYILSGQSNMEGKAQISTFDRIGMTSDSAPMLNDMVGPDGKPVVLEDVYISFLGARRQNIEAKGALTAGFGDKNNKRQTHIGPEFTFGIYMDKLQNEPMLIIKTAWGGKSLHTDFLSPGGTKRMKDKETGKYYKMMMDHINKVLNNLENYHPAYDPSAGYEISGFVWFQGYNDFVSGDVYKDNKDAPEKTYELYSKLLAQFIRDVRKDLKKPKLPFVIGVLGVGGSVEKDSKMQNFRNAMAAPASMPEFEGTVEAVHTAKYWDVKTEKLQQRIDEAAEKAVLEENPGYKNKPVALRNEKNEIREEIRKKVLSDEEKAFLDAAVSNADYHYKGSAYTIGKIGKAFAEAMFKLQKNGE